MKFKNLFLCMLGAAVLVGCNNEVGPDGKLGPDGKPIIVEGESTTATFQFKVNSANTYAGGTSLAGTGNENALGNAGLFIYKEDGTPEAMAFLSAVPTAPGPDQHKVTVKCFSGIKFIYLAVNIGTSSTNMLLGAAGLNTTNTATPDFLGVAWDELTAPYFDRVNVTYERLNAPI